jgi:lactoylglutathione lyase
MKIEHLALWTTDIDRCIAFYATYFGATAGPRYHNPAKGFTSHFLTFDGGSRLEVMASTTLSLGESVPRVQRLGLTHFAIALGSDEAVDRLTERLRADGFPILDGPRRTGDGYYESVTLDPDGNRVELTA